MQVCCYNYNKTGVSVINDPLGETQSPQYSDHYFLLFCFSRFKKWGRTDGRTTCANTIIPTGSGCGLAEWINNIFFKKCGDKWSKIFFFHNLAIKIFQFQLDLAYVVNQVKKEKVIRKWKWILRLKLFGFYIKNSQVLIHSANPKSRPVGIIVFAYVVRPSIPTSQKSSKTKQS